MRTRVSILLALLTLIPAFAVAETVRIEADRDATLIEDADGSLANGSGAVFFVGRTAQATGSIRRGLLWFDVAAHVPQQAIVESAELNLYMTPSNPGLRTIRVHRVLADWAEGASSASGGAGDAAVTGDATWLHTFYDIEFWVHGGGQFVGRASAQFDVGRSAFYTWGSTNHLVQDVRLWKSAPRQNYGWILIGDETVPQTVKSFASREDPQMALRPVLEVTYRMPGR